MDEVFTSMMPVPDLSCPPPGWGGQGANMRPYRGRGSEGNSHPTRVFKRTDQRPRGAGGQQRSHYQHQQRPPRFSNLHDRFSNLHEDVPDPVKPRRSSWGDVWRPEVDVVEVEAAKVTGEVMEGREESSSDEGEWKEVKKGRRGGAKEDPKKPNSSRTSPTPTSSSYRRNTPEPQPLIQQNTKRRSPINSNRKSPDQRQVNNKDRSRRSPDQNISKRSPEDLRKKLDRRGSSSSNEGPKSGYSNKSSENLSDSPPAPNHEELMKRIPQMMMVSDLPDEKLARTKKFTRRISETEMMIKKEEEKIKIQDEILYFLKETWSEICTELNENENHWPSKICYFKC